MRWLAASGRALLRVPGVARCQACRCQSACGPLVVPQRGSCSAWASSIAAGWRHNAGIASRRAAAVASVTRQGLQPGAQTLSAGASVKCQCMLWCSIDLMKQRWTRIQTLIRTVCHSGTHSRRQAMQSSERTAPGRREVAGDKAARERSRRSARALPAPRSKGGPR